MLLYRHQLLLWSAAALTTGAAAENLQECVTNFDANTMVDYFPSKVVADDSQHWSVEYFDTYKVVTNSFYDETYVLYQCGTPEPQLDFVPSVITPVPLPDGVAVTTTTVIPYLELLGLRGEIKTYLGNDSYVSSPCFLELKSLDQIETMDSNPISAANATIWLSTNDHPERLIFDASWQITPSDRTVSIGASKEGPNADVFEWLEFYSLFFNKEAEAKRILDSTSQRAQCISSNAQTLQETDGETVQAIWAYYSNWDPSVPPTWSLATCDPKFNYYCEFAQACNVDLISVTNDGTAPGLTNEEFSVLAKDADVFFYVSTDFDTVYANPNNAFLNEFRSVQNKQVFDYQKSGSNAWFEQRMAEYDVVMQDFCTVVNRTTNAYDHQRKWFRNVFTEEVGDLGTCGDNLYAPLTTQSSPCLQLDSSGNKEGALGGNPNIGSGGGGDKESTTNPGSDSTVETESSLQGSDPTVQASSEDNAAGSRLYDLAAALSVFYSILTLAL